MLGALLLMLGIDMATGGITGTRKRFWRDTLVKNPDCSMAYNNLGLLLVQQGHIEEAMEYSIRPSGSIRITRRLNNLVTPRRRGQLDEAIGNFAGIQINRITPERITTWVLCRRPRRFDEAIETFQRPGQSRSSRDIGQPGHSLAARPV